MAYNIALTNMLRYNIKRYEMLNIIYRTIELPEKSIATSDNLL